MKLIRIGNDIQIEWAITRYGEPEDFSNKNLSVGLYDKFNNKQIFEYTIEDNVISGIFYGKDQTTNGVYRLYLTENYGEEDMISLDYIDCFCLSNKLKNQTSNGKDSSNINTEVVQLSSSINVGGTIVQSDWNETDPDSPNYIKNKPEIFSGDYDDLTNKPTIPENTSDLYNDSGFVTSSSLATVATSGNYNDLLNKPTIPTVPTNVSAFTNDAGYLTQHQSLANCVQSTTTGMRIEVVNAMPVNPDQNTLYIVA